LLNAFAILIFETGGWNFKSTIKKKGPKRAISAYAFFTKVERAAIQTAHPEASFGELSVLVGAVWNSMDEEAKQPYALLAIEDKERARMARETWKSKHGEDAFDEAKDCAGCQGKHRAHTCGRARSNAAVH
jgi:hypothetical protein